MRAPLRLPMSSIRMAFRFRPSAWTPRFQGIELCIASARISSCVLLAQPRWLFLLSRHRKTLSAAANQKPFVNKDLCTRKSVKRIIKEVKAKRLASAWQISGSFSQELEQYSYND